MSRRQPAEADRLDDAYRSSGPIGPLHGIPVILKDQIDARGMATTLGSVLFKDFYPDKDAFIVERLRAAGAVIRGKTNLSAWANFRSSRSTSGWSTGRTS